MVRRGVGSGVGVGVCVGVGAGVFDRDRVCGRSGVGSTGCGGEVRLRAPVHLGALNGGGVNAVTLRACRWIGEAVCDGVRFCAACLFGG